MTLKLYNTLSRKKEVFKPLRGKNVKFFVCGPTVYDAAHIGHAKTYVQFDMIVKYLRQKGYKIFYLQNITNIDDKIITRAKELKEDPLKLAKEKEKEYYQDLKALSVDSIDKFARATDYIPQIIKQIQTLLKKGYAYETGDGIYFKVSEFKEYGKLSKQNTKEIKEHSRVGNEDKKDAVDFVLWKKEKPNEPSWPSPFGKGRPGWHIEDTAITETEFGPQYDAHGGALDLIFPHHEAEIAQMEAASGKKPLVKYWLHTGFLNIAGKKMAKSLGNFMTIKDALQKYAPETIRFTYATNHYRSPIDYSEKVIEQYESGRKRLQEFYDKVKKGKDSTRSDKALQKAKKKYHTALEDDFNTAEAFGAIFDLIRDINRLEQGGKSIVKFLKEVNDIFAILSNKKDKIPSSITSLAKQRETARGKKDFKKADELRNKIQKAGYILEDTPTGFRLKK